MKKVSYTSNQENTKSKYTKPRLMLKFQKQINQRIEDNKMREHSHKKMAQKFATNSQYAKIGRA